ncbi:MAG: phenylacetate-CoA oxygenase subunit PaaJ, partial [Phycisphaerales bacterium]|nr:phenylacetate-CoA oxygenase subunit PaaJ [Phycisphaerales bacterium]
PWSSDRISPAGLEKLRAFGLAIPRRMDGREVELTDLEDAACPYCRSNDTILESTFGPTLCRAIYYCHQCRQSFEQFKPVS